MSLQSRMVNHTQSYCTRPTFCFYAGTTGMKVGEEFEKMRATLPEENQRYIEYFFFDSDKPETQNYARSRHYFYSDLYDFMSETHKPFCEDRYPKNIGLTPVVNSSNGNGVTRIFGASSLVNNMDDFFKTLAEGYRRLMKQKKERTRRPQVFITCGMGGTGSGMAIDIAAFVKDYFKNICGENPEVYFFLIGPDILVKDPDIHITDFNQDRMRALTYAFIKELNHFAEGNPFVSSYKTSDHKIKITNRNGDLLFDWTYFYNGNVDNINPGIDEVIWNIAEIQFHLSATGIGRKIIEILPNQREERHRNFPLDFTHAESRNRLTEAEKDLLRGVSRKTWLAGAHARNVRFCAPEIRALFESEYTAHGLHMLVNRVDRNGVDDAEEIEVFDRMLGTGLYADSPEGLLCGWGLTDRKIAAKIDEILEPWLEDLTVPKKNAGPDRILEGVGSLLQKMENLKEDFTITDAHRLPEPVREIIDECCRSLADQFEENGAIFTQLKSLCYSSSSGWGLRRTGDLLAHLIRELRRRESIRSRTNSSRENLENIEGLTQRYHRYDRACKDQSKRFSGKLLKQFRKLTGGENPTPYPVSLAQKVERLVREAGFCRETLQEYLRAQLSNQLSAVIYKFARERFVRYQKNTLLPTLKNVGEALRMAENAKTRCRERMHTFQGDGWISHSTIHLGGDENTISSLRRRLPDMDWLQDALLEPFSGTGLVHGRERLTADEIHQKTPDMILRLIHRQVVKNLNTHLEFLDEGWRLEESASLWTECAKHLDMGCEPLIHYDRSGVSARPQSWLIAPEEMLLPDPFGQRVSGFKRIPSQDPLCITVVSAVYGIPPNALYQMHEQFNHYRAHIGDHKPESDGYDRYPLHVFRNGMKFNEPHSPVGLNFDAAGLQNLLDLARQLRLINGDPTIEMDVHSFPADVAEWVRLPGYQNSVIELAERILKTMILNGMPAPTSGSEDSSEDMPTLNQLKTNGLAPLMRLYEQRISLQ